MTGAHLTVQAVTVHIGHTTALREITIDVAAGSRHVVTGPNGAGKTTLLAAIAGTRRISAGQIALDGHAITGRPPHRIARLGVARTWQQPAVCEHLTALDNIQLGIHGRHRAAERHARAAALLAAANLDGHAATPAGALSYGQRRRLELAVALASQPRLVLLDEPSAGLTDNDTTHLVAQLRALSPGATLLIVEHNPDVVDALADTITTLDRGRVVGTAPANRIDVSCAGGQQHRPSEHVDDSAAATRPQASPLLQVRNLSAGYHGTTVLHGLDLDLHAGDILRVNGPNGAGKSTLLHALAGLIPTGTDTHITMHGHSITRLSAAARARHGIALVPQDGRLFATLTIEENLEIATRNSTPSTWPITELLDLLPILRHRRRDRAATLSGGEQQVLSLARSLATQPRVLLLDEPFTRLAPAIAHNLRHLITQVADRGTAVLLIDHNAPRAPIATRTATLTDGTLHAAPSGPRSPVAFP